MKTIVCELNILLFYSMMASTSRSLELLWVEKSVTDNEGLEALLLTDERVSTGMPCSIYTISC